MHLQHQKLLKKYLAVENFTLNFDNRHLVADQMLSETPAELDSEERIVFGKKTIDSATCTSYFGLESGTKIHLLRYCSFYGKRYYC